MPRSLMKIRQDLLALLHERVTRLRLSGWLSAYLDDADLFTELEMP